MANKFKAFWKSLEFDSTPIEVAMCLFGIAFGASCYFGGWFGDWLPKMHEYHGLELHVFVGAIIFNSSAFYVAISGQRYMRLRQFFAMINAIVLASISSATFPEYGFHYPAGIVVAVGAIINMWVFISLYALRLDIRRSSKEGIQS